MFDPDDYLQVWTLSPERALAFFGLDAATHEVVILKTAPETERERASYRADAVLYGIRATPAVPGAHHDRGAFDPAHDKCTRCGKRGDLFRTPEGLRCGPCVAYDAGG